MDGQPLFVQSNLLDFLHTMQSTAPRGDPIFDPELGHWIDALCIDQKDTSERNHWVAQIGVSYSNADYVHIWLGAAPPTQCLHRLTEGPTPDASLGEWSALARRDLSYLKQHVFNNT
jgi:hypothetical protein